MPIKQFTEQEYDVLHEIVFASGYPGYKPAVKEVPAGDGVVDADKIYAHIAPEYLKDHQNVAEKMLLRHFYDRAFAQARYAWAVSAGYAGLPGDLVAAFAPDPRYGALRVLDYPPGAVSNRHEDFDLFTLVLYRDDPDALVVDHSATPGAATDSKGSAGKMTATDALRAFDPKCHLGQIAAEIGIGPATPHEVVGRDRSHHSVVYFAIPDHDAVLPSGKTVRDWLNDKMQKTRTELKPLREGDLR